MSRLVLASEVPVGLCVAAAVVVAVMVVAGVAPVEAPKLRDR